MKKDTQHLLLPSNLQLNGSQPVLKLCQWLSIIGVLVWEIQDATICAPYLTLGAVQCDQTSVWPTPRIMCREEVGQSLQRRVPFLLRRRSQNGNNLDRSTGALSARRWWMGIFAVARLARLPNEQLLDPICGMPGAVSGPKLGTLIHCSSFKEGSFHEKEKPDRDGKRHCLLCKKRDG